MKIFKNIATKIEVALSNKLGYTKITIVLSFIAFLSFILMYVLNVK